ncbi:acetylpolyamine aminohydrolase [Exidia glandulosa HHB12029]|uniref:Acetylpolyamine aminohydrolase n=1 Tax=Exidia glandulosa HHB12029 TaxID=1314781 RepID=A0A165HNN0_EXIGL|nr:acetylpolyamine aminohydrolase [Exidia glandulosa HHB12029]
MLVVHSPLCLLHDPPTEILSGKPVPYKESPDRLVRVRNALSNDPQRKYELTAVDDGLDILPDILRVHSEDYVFYLRRAYSDWVEEGGDKQGVLPESFPHPKLPPYKLDPAKMSAIARAGYYCFDLSCPITEDTFEAIMASARVAVRAAQLLVDGTQSTAAPHGIFALTRPPGHHAGTGVCGGYCYLNNAAIAVRCLQDAVPSAAAKPRVAILDIDYHHGNGSQEIFYSDDSVFYVSLHAEGDYPYFTGSSVEEGEGSGVKCNLNLPLPQHTTGNEQYLATLDLAGKAISDYSPDYLVVSLGVDTYKDDPICCFNLTTPCYSRIGARIRELGLPTLFLFEGGYCMEVLGENVKGVLDGFIGS